MNIYVANEELSDDLIHELVRHNIAVVKAAAMEKIGRRPAGRLVGVGGQVLGHEVDREILSDPWADSPRYWEESLTGQVLMDAAANGEEVAPDLHSHYVALSESDRWLAAAYADKVEGINPLSLYRWRLIRAVKASGVSFPSEDDMLRVGLLCRLKRT